MRKLTFLIFFSFLIGCSINQSIEPTFGASYTINLNEQSPLIQSDSLIVSLSYSGCSDLHSFILQKHISSSTSEIWLFKETADQPCDGIVQEERSFEITEEIRTSKSIVFVTPKEETVILK
tara:strand:+ start:40 stop:402 length:363 start_codon:yes stop_codon:yes gene_type:complete